MTVDQQGCACFVLVLVVSAKVHFANSVQWEGINLGLRRCIQVCGAHKHVVNVKQQTTACAVGNLGKELCLVHVGFSKGQIAGRVFEQHLTSERVLDLINMASDTGDSCSIVGQGQQIV